jgi:DNA topoisomerase-1
MNEGEPSKLVDITPSQHFTQPPPRYSEASLVKKLEELGIGRPSTYASILQVLRDRKYVLFEKRRFIPEDRGRLVTTFLSKFFARYVDYDFTANLEEELDAIASGEVAWKEALRQFWVDFKAAVDQTKDLTITQVIDHLDEELGPHFFPVTKDNPKPKICKACGTGTLGLRLGKFGAFIGCSNYPECKFTRPLVLQGDDSDPALAALSNEPKILGKDPGTSRTVSLRRGPYGPYVQIDLPPEVLKEIEEEKAEAARIKEMRAAAKAKGEKFKAPPKKKKPEDRPKPKRQGLPKGMAIDEVTLEAALKLLALPRDVGKHPETGEMIQAGVGRFGPFLKHQNKFTSLPKDDDVLTVGINRAVDVLVAAAEKAAAREAKGYKPRGRFQKKDKKEETPAAEEKKSTSKKPAPKKKKAAAKKKSAE